MGIEFAALHGGHVGRLRTAGMLNGIFGQVQSRHIAQWQSVKVVEKTEEKMRAARSRSGEKAHFANELTVAFANGRVTTLK
jgi:hypothetical protein